MSGPGTSNTPNAAVRLAHRFSLSLAIALIGCIASGLLYRALLQEDRARVALEVRHEESKLKEKLENHLHERLRALRRMASRWEVRPPSEEEWQYDVELFLRDLHGLQELTYIDPSGHLRWVYPLQGNEGVRGIDLHAEPVRSAAMDRARVTRSTVVTKTVPLLIGDRGFLAFLPLHDRKTDAFQGYLSGVFRLENTLDAALGPDVSHFSAVVYEGDQAVFRSHLSPPPEGLFRGRVVVETQGLNWRIELQMLPTRAAQLQSLLPRMALISGTLMTLLICAAVFLAQSAVERTRVLRSTTQRQRALLDGSDYGILFVGVDGTILDFNAGAEKMLGYSAPELIGKATLDRLHRPSELERRAGELSPLLSRPVSPNADAITAVARADGSDEREWIYVRRDGTSFPVQLSVTAIKEAPGDLSGFLAIASDITRRKEDDERFRVLFEEIGRARSQLMDAIESLDAGFAMYDTEDRLVISNRKYKELYEVGAEVLTAGRTHESILAMLVQRGVHLASGLSKEEWISQERVSRRQDVEPSEQRVGKRWIRSNDRRTREGFWVCLRTDITRIKQAQEDLKIAKDAAEEATKAKSEFLARMSHEIRTPMNGVTGMLELALRTPLTPEQKEFMETARSSAKSLLSLINDILDFSKVEAGQLQLDARPFRLRDGLGEMLKSLSVRAAEQGLELMFSASPQVPDRLVGDVQRLRQVVTNLVGNAIKFTSNGEILVTCEVDSRTDRGDVTLHFTVVDSGIGIPKDKLDRIFDAFAQADEATNRRYGGTGLGLAICRQLCGLMGGRIWVESKENEGSKFHFTACFSHDLGAPAAPAAMFEAGTVLIVDDSAQHRLILQEQFNQWRMTARAVPDAKSALEVLQQASWAGEPISLLVLNGDLPGEASTWLLAAMARDAAVWKTPVIWLAATGTALPELHPAHIRRVSKPVVPSPLFEAAQALLTGALTSVPQPPSHPSPSAVTVKRKLKVLVADDNAINRQVAKRLLEMDGHEVVAVVDGFAAVEAVRTQQFDAVLMDVQMPEMDGFTASRTIRAAEAEAGKGKRLPIIAVTAQAMKGDDQRCLEAQMDDYVAKPIDPLALTQALERAVAKAAGFTGPKVPEAVAGKHGPAGTLSVKPAAPERAGVGSEEPIDMPRLFALVGESKELLAEAAELFRIDLPDMVKSVHSNLSEGNADGLAKAAHKLKGALLSLSAGPAAGLAEQLEEMGKGEQLGGAKVALSTLEQELSRVESALARVLSARG